MKVLFIFSLFLLHMICFGQLPFEKYKAIRTTAIKNWIDKDLLEKEAKVIASITVPGVLSSKESITIQITFYDTLGYCNIRLLKNGKTIQDFTENFAGPGSPYPVYTADYNNDQLTDIKFLIPYHGCGAYNTYSNVIYLLQRKDGRFTKLSFVDHFFEGDTNRPERDMDGDGNFEVITQTFQHHENHNYWLYNIYAFKNFQLVNINNPFAYPIMIQLLHVNNYAVTRNLSREKMKTYARKLPDDYSVK